jgi:hypothetical protein
MFGRRKGLEGLVWREEGEGDGTTAGKILPFFNYVQADDHLFPLF